MSIATAITDLQGRIEDAYDALEAKGATMPSVRNTANMPDAIESIPTGAARDSTTKMIWSSNFYMANVQGQLNKSNWPLPSGLAINNITYLYVGEGVTEIAADLCKGITGLRILELPSTLLTISSQAFYGCSGLMNVTISNGVKSIGQQAFYGCNILTSVTIPNSVRSIGTEAFHYCYGLTSVTIDNGVTSIGNWAFDNCGRLSSVTIPASVTSIGQGAFRYCDSNFTVVMEGRTVAQVQAMNPIDWFDYSYMTVTVVCTDGSFTLVVSCFLKGTKILLADDTEKNIEDLTYDDVLKVWDFDEGQLGSAKVCWLTRSGLTNDHYYQLTFSDGTILKTTGKNSNHKVFNVDKQKFEGVDKTQVGDKIYSINGVVTVTDKQYIEEECEYYNVMTSEKINCFANGILTSDRYGNLYPIVDMKYVKDGRAIRPYSEYEAVGIDRYWYDNLRLGENTETVEESRRYVMKCYSQMLPLPTAQS